jgi:hypothetical protein
MQTPKWTEILLILEIQAHAVISPFHASIVCICSQGEWLEEVQYWECVTAVRRHVSHVVRVPTLLESETNRRTSPVRDGGRLTRNAGRCETYTSRTSDVTARPHQSHERFHPLHKLTTNSNFYCRSKIKQNSKCHNKKRDKKYSLFIHKTGAHVLV